MLSPFVVYHLCTIIVTTNGVALATTTPPARPAENRQFGLQITSLSIIANRELSDVNVTHKAASISFSADVKQTLNGPIKFDLLLQIRTRESFERDSGPSGDPKAFRTFINSSIDYCEFLNNPLLNPFLNLLHSQAVNKPGNHMFTKCPIQTVR